MDFYDKTPGPGQYSLTKALKIRDKSPGGPKFPKADLNKVQKTTIITPGPGHYIIDKDEKIHDRVLCYFGDKNDRDKFFYPDLLNKTSNNPIEIQKTSLVKKKPAIYQKNFNINQIFKKDFIFIDRDKAHFPGPGHYQLSPHKKPKGTSGIKFPISKEIRTSYLKKDKGPGPGDYNIVIKQREKGLKFKEETYKSLRKIGENQEKPGPGSYSFKPSVILNRFFPKTPAFSFKKAKSQSPKQNTPGPFDYSPKISGKQSPSAFFGLAYKETCEKEIKNEKNEVFEENYKEKAEKIKGLIFGNEKRVMVFGENRNKEGISIGPGEYDPGFGGIHKKGVAIGFGKSEREGKIRKSPGPGDYL